MSSGHEPVARHDLCSLVKLDDKEWPLLGCDTEHPSAGDT